MVDMGRRMLRVAINAQLPGNGRAGGVEPAVRGLVQALGRLADRDVEYVIVTHPWSSRWLDAVLGDQQRRVVHPYPASVRLRPCAERAVRALAPLKLVLRPGWRWLEERRARREAAEAPRPARSTGFWESLGVDVVHFPYQTMVLADVPSLYNPWDLQHLHLPELFDPHVIARREATYPVYCRHARAVITASRFTRQDVIERYGIEPAKVYVAPLAAATELGAPVADDAMARVRARYRVPSRFAFYPAQTWPHKNHVRLLEAVALLRDRHGLALDVVCTGARNQFWPTIARRRQELGLANQVRFLGFVGSDDLRALYRLATFVVIPSLFEGWGFPLIEAFREDVAVATSDAAALGEYAADAALVFDARSVDAIAEAMARLATDDELRASLVVRGRKRVETFSWERAARTHRALYRYVGGAALSEEDRWLLAAAS